MCIGIKLEKKDQYKYWIFNKEVTWEEWSNRYKLKNDKQAAKEKKPETLQQNERPLQRKTIEEFWKAFERRQCELLQETGIALGKILRGEAA